MKVLFCVRHNFYSAPGGAQIQILKTKEYLEKLGVVCDITATPYNVNYCKYDIIHLTDLTWVYDNILYIKEIKKSKFKGKKYLSTIYWPFDDYASNGAPFLQKIIYKIFGINGFEFFKALGKFFLKRELIYLEGIKKSYIENQKFILDNVDFLLPNAEKEMEVLKERLNLKEFKYHVIPNSIDTVLFDDIISKYKVEKDDNLITYVARIDSRKNQINFIKALENTDYKILFIGNPGPNSTDYYKKLKLISENRGNVEFISHITQEEVFKYMLKAKVNVLVSWIETPGLVNIEASYAKANIVISDKGSVREYFHDYAFYCDPDDLLDIKRKVEIAMKTKFDDRFIEVIKEKYTWENTARETLNAYNLSNE